MPETTENRDRFERVIIPRVRRAVQAVELIGNGAARNYETTQIGRASCRERV